MRNRKLLLAFLFATILAFEGISLGWSAYTDGENTLIEHAFRTTFALYIGVLVVRSVGQCTIHHHSESVIHITALTFFSSVLHFAVAILPSSDSISAHSIHELPPLLALWYAVTVSYILTFAIIATTPRGPPLHYLWFASPFFVRKLIAYLEGDPDRLDRGWGWVYALAQFASLVIVTQRNFFFVQCCLLRCSCVISQQSNVVHRNNCCPNSLAHAAQYHALREDTCAEGHRFLFRCPIVCGEKRQKY
jgi:hypothetical protein